MVLKCCVPGCTNKGRFGFHKFPRDIANCMKWQYKTRKRNLNTEYLPFTQLRVCDKHFKDGDYVHSLGKKRLKKTSTPNVLVPDDESIYEEHCYAVVLPEKTAEEHTKTKLSRPSFVDPEPEYFLQDSGPEENCMQNNENPKAKVKGERIPPYVHRQMRNQARRIKMLQKRLKDANNFGKQKVINYLSKHFKPDQMTFFELQLRNIGKRNHGQRYTNEEKTMMLAIYKRGPRVYRYISLLFGLPNRRTLSRHSARMQFETGINDKLFELLKSTASKLSHLDKICTLGWDEMALTHHLSYCTSGDFIDGYVDFGDVRLPEFATHSLTFMVRGVNSAYKQPVAYFYSQNLTSLEIAELVKLVIRAVHDTGLRIIGSVCDQTVTMASAVNRLISPHLEGMKQTGMLLCYYIDGIKVIHCFDPPHILKTLRNNLLVKNLIHSVSGIYEPDGEPDENNDDENVKKMFARWDNIKSFHEFDIKNSCRLAPKITNNHVNPENDKMKVSLASQVFSRTLGSVMLFCSQHNLSPSDYSGTAYFLLFVNNLFDSLNGGGKPEIGTFRGSINESNKYKYYNFWEYAISNLKKMDFIDKGTGDINNKSTVILKTISTIRGYMELTKICFASGIKSISLRQMNQDGLENFFGGVRSVCHNAKSPIAASFRAGYTNLILSNLTSTHSISANCEDDGNKSLLRNVCDLYDDPRLIMNGSGASPSTDDSESVIDLEVTRDELVEMKFIENDALTAESSNACKSIITSMNCELCKDDLQLLEPLNEHRILASTYQFIPLITFPSLLFIGRFKLLFKTVETLIPFVCHEKNLFQKLISSLDNVELGGIGCVEHESVIAMKMKRIAVEFCVTNFIKQINGILSKKIIYRLPNDSVIHKKAFDIVKKKKGIGKHGQKMII